MVMSKRVHVHLILALMVIVSLSSASLSQTEKKAAYSVLIDNTGSMRSQFDLVIRLSKGIVEQTYQRGPISLFPFKSQGDKNKAVVSSDIEWSEDKTILDKYIDSIFVVPGQTNLMDGIHVIAVKLNAKVDVDKDAFEVKIIFLITDGEDRFSKISEKELIKTLKESGIKVFAIGLVNELDNESGLIRKAPRDLAVTFLEKVTKETGGRAVFPKSKKVDVGVLLDELFTK